jgi:hypothetical protein
MSGEGEVGWAVWSWEEIVGGRRGEGRGFVERLWERVGGFLVLGALCCWLVSPRARGFCAGIGDEYLVATWLYRSFLRDSPITPGPPTSIGFWVLILVIIVEEFEG